MSVYTISKLVAFEATERGALDGWKAECSCGLEIRSSLERLAGYDVLAHRDWHEGQGDRVSMRY